MNVDDVRQWAPFASSVLITAVGAAVVYTAINVSVQADIDSLKRFQDKITPSVENLPLLQYQVNDLKNASGELKSAIEEQKKAMEEERRDRFELQRAIEKSIMQIDALGVIVGSGGSKK